MTKKKSIKCGPKSDLLKIECDWQSAVTKAIKKKLPKEGWPKKGKKNQKSD